MNCKSASHAVQSIIKEHGFSPPAPLPDSTPRPNICPAQSTIQLPLAQLPTRHTSSLLSEARGFFSHAPSFVVEITVTAGSFNPKPTRGT